MSIAQCMPAEQALRYLKLAASSPQPTNACSENYSSDKGAWLTFQKTGTPQPHLSAALKANHQAHNVHKGNQEKREGNFSSRQLNGRATAATQTDLHHLFQGGFLRPTRIGVAQFFSTPMLKQRIPWGQRNAVHQGIEQ